MPGFLASRGKEFNLGRVMRLNCSELLCNKEIVSDIDARREQKECPLLVFSWMLQATSSLLIRERKCLKTQRMAPGPSPTTCLEITLAPGESSRAYKMIDINLEERQISIQIHSFINID